MQGREPKRNDVTVHKNIDSLLMVGKPTRDFAAEFMTVHSFKTGNSTFKIDITLTYLLHYLNFLSISGKFQPFSGPNNSTTPSQYCL